MPGQTPPLVLPAATGAADPFAQDGAGEHQTTFMFLQAVLISEAAWPVARMQTAIRRREEVGGNGEARTFGDVVDVADDFQPSPSPTIRSSNAAKLLAGAFNARRNNARGDDGGFKQAEIIFGEIEYFREVRDVSGGAQVHAGQIASTGSSMTRK